MSQEKADDSVYLYTTLEGENRKLHLEQVKQINSSLRAVRRLKRKSMQEFEAVEATVAIEEKVTSTRPGFYVEKPNRIEHIGPDAAADAAEREDDTGQFCIPEPDETVKFDQVLEKAFGFIAKERKSIRAPKTSPVVKRWRLV